MKKKLLIVLGSGGHTAQILKLLSLLGNKYTYEYVVNDTDLVSSKKVRGKIYILPNPRVFEDSNIKRAWKLILGVLKSVKIIFKSKPYAIISAGPGLTFPLFLAGKIFRTKNIFLETWCRVTIPSMSGKLCYPFSDLFFVQWPELQEKYPKSIYAGRLS